MTFDKRGQGLSDRVSGAPSLEERMDDVRAVMDAIGSKRAALIGYSEGAAISAMFAATYPERATHLIVFGSFANALPLSPEQHEERIRRFLTVWGTGVSTSFAVPSRAGDPNAVAQFAKFERLCASPGSVRATMQLNSRIDVRPILPIIRVPTFVTHCQADAIVAVERGREFAAAIPNAKYKEYPGGDHSLYTDVSEVFLGDVREFITGSRDVSLLDDSDRILATILFTDIADSTATAVRLGDQSWRRLLDDHDRLAKQFIEKYRGALIKTTGDGILARFDGPGRAIRCALEFGGAVRQIGLPIRAGVHTGEIELRGSDIGGVAVHAAARVMAQSGANEVVVSRVVADLVAGAGLKFSERGSYELKGLPGRWELYAASV